MTAWLDLEKWEPSRADWYAMQGAAEARRGWVKEPHKVQVTDFLHPFSPETSGEEGQGEKGPAQPVPPEFQGPPPCTMTDAEMRMAMARFQAAVAKKAKGG